MRGEGGRKGSYSIQREQNAENLLSKSFRMVRGEGRGGGRKEGRIAEGEGDKGKRRRERIGSGTDRSGRKKDWETGWRERIGMGIDRL